MSTVTIKPINCLPSPNGNSNIITIGTYTPVFQPQQIRFELPPTARLASDAGRFTNGDSWVQILVQRALLNAVLKVRNAVVKLVDGRVVASLSLRSLEIVSTDGVWQPAFVQLVE